MAEYSTSIDIDASPARVFAFLVTDEGMQAWMGQHAALDAQPGGRFAVDIAGHPVRGRFLEVEPHSRVVVSWGFAGSDELPRRPLSSSTTARGRAATSTVPWRSSPTTCPAAPPAATSTTPAAECFTVRAGRIIRNVLIFDRLSYGPPA